MTRTAPLLVVCGLLVFAGCLGGFDGSPSSSPTTSASPSTPTPSATPTNAPPATSSIASDAAGRMAIRAEKPRIERRVNETEAVSGFGFGILRPAESEVVRRNETGAFVHVSVGYSFELDCDGDGEVEEAIDGASTETTYFVGDEVDGERVHLTNVSRDVVSPERFC